MSTDLCGGQLRWVFLNLDLPVAFGSPRSAVCQSRPRSAILGERERTGRLELLGHSTPLRLCPGLHLLAPASFTTQRRSDVHPVNFTLNAVITLVCTGESGQMVCFRTARPSSKTNTAWRQALPPNLSIPTKMPHSH